MFEFLSDWKNWAKEKGQTALTKVKPALMRLRRRVEVLPGNTVTLATLSATTLLAGIYNRFVFVTHMGEVPDWNPIRCDMGSGSDLERNYFNRVLGFNIRNSHDFIHQALLLGAAAFTMLQMFRAKRSVQVKKVEAASNAKRDLKKIKENYDTAFLPTPVSDLLSLSGDPMGADSKSLSEKQKFAVLANYINAEYPPEVLCRVLKEERLSKVRDEEDNTLLHVAAEKGDTDLVKRLISIEFDLDPSAENKKGVKARTLAYASEPLVAEILLQHERMLHAFNSRVVPYASASSATGTKGPHVRVDVKPDSKSNTERTLITASV